ncbi:MAG: 3-deoxy-8-phosphooctulonate synthase [Verrucomicrobiota bacterium]
MPAIDVAGTQFDGQEPVFILGPCVIESEDFLMDAARRTIEIARAAGVRFLFKASFDKANRTSIGSFRGPGLEEGLRLLRRVKEEFGVGVTTDIHTPEQAEAAAGTIDLLQIPAFLCRQTDLLVAAAGTGQAVNVKKGQFLAPWDAEHIMGKLRESGCERILLTERGSSFGYNTLVADMRSLIWMRELGARVIFDATHSVQRPGGLGGSSGGDGRLAPVLARAAVATGVDGIFMETHPNPAQALSDGPNQVPLEALHGVLTRLQKIHHAAHDEA